MEHGGDARYLIPARLLSPAGRGPARRSSARFGRPTSRDTRLIHSAHTGSGRHEPSACSALVGPSTPPIIPCQASPTCSARLSHFLQTYDELSAGTKSLSPELSSPSTFFSCNEVYAIHSYVYLFCIKMLFEEPAWALYTPYIWTIHFIWNEHANKVIISYI
jgi:hypothetical protein